MTDKQADRDFILGAIAILLFLYLLWKKKSALPQGYVTSQLVGPAVPVDQNPSMDTFFEDTSSSGNVRDWST